MRVLLCGGGTAGHVMPAVAIGEIITKKYPDAIIAFAGRCNAEENRAYQNTKHTLYTIDIQGLRRSIDINNIKTVFKLIKSSRKAKEIIENFKPDLIIGTGGYVSYPFLRQGQRLNIKTMLHESNVYPGLVTRILGGKCDSLLLNFEGAKKYLKTTDNVTVVGNPVRSGFGKITKKEARKKLKLSEGDILIISFGGSLGAKNINLAVAKMLENMNVCARDIRYVHATGRSDYKEFQKNHPELFKTNNRISILPYIDDMPTYMTAADLAITRSGAMTISELCRSATPSILIPSPNVTANHQFINAEYMKKIGAAELIEEKNLTAETLEKLVNDMISNKGKLKSYSKKASLAYFSETDKMIQSILDNLLIDK